MDQDIDIEHFRQRLLEAREDILALEETRDGASGTVHLDQSSVGRLSRMDALQQQAMAKSGQQRARQALLMIEAALRRCEDGRYGYCLDCDEPINPRRLELDPSAPRCVTCTQTRDS